MKDLMESDLSGALVSSSASRMKNARIQLMRWRDWVVTATICFGTVVAAALGEPAYHAYTREDGICETLQVVFFVLALIEAIRAFRALQAGGRKSTVGLYLIAILGLCFLVGEEISWGQRIFGWSTPEDLAQINRQGETTLHNIGEAHDMVGWVLLAIGFWGSVLPWLLRPGAPLARMHETLSPFVPSVRFAPYFLPMLVWRIYRNFFPLPSKFTYAVVQLNEPLELIMAIGFWLFFLDRRRAYAASPATSTMPSAKTRAV
jgi:hypothetical protein